MIIIILSQKLANDAIDHAWIYPPSTTKQRSSSEQCSSLNASLNYPLSTKPIYAVFTNENILNHPLAICLDPPHDVASLPDLSGYDRTWGCWIQPLHQHEDLLGTLILEQSKVDESFFVVAPLFANLTSYAWQWPEWKFEDWNYSTSHLQTDQSCSDAILKT